jgi:hypothetical protein
LSLRYSKITKIVSDTTPITTSHVKKDSHQCNDKREASRQSSNCLNGTGESTIEVLEAQDRVSNIGLIAAILIPIIGIIVLFSFDLWDKYIP